MPQTRSSGMTAALITGGAGFIGSHVAALLQVHTELRVLDNFRSGQPQNLEGLAVQLFEGTILDRPLLDRALAGVSHVFHLAAMVSVEESMTRPLDCLEVNAGGTLRLLEAAAAAGVRRVVFSSSAAVYGERPEALKHEDLPPDPRSPYAVTKLDGEYYCRLYAADRGLEAVSLRYFNVFGPRQDPSSPYAAAVPIFIRRALAGEPLDVFGDGQQTRDFIYAADVAEANLLAATHPEASGVYNVGSESELTIAGLARQIIGRTGSPSQIRFLPPRPGDLRHSRAATARLRSLGFRPRYSLEEGLGLTIAHFQKGKGR